MSDYRNGAAALRADPMQQTLAKIESHVLEDVWIGARRRAGYACVTVLLVIAVASWCCEIVVRTSAHGLDRVPVISVAAMAVAAAVSALALGLRRFRVCFAAAYTCGLATIIGIGALWWSRTGPPGLPLTWLVVADMAAALLTVGWVWIALIPIAQSQPQMRAHRCGEG